MRNFLFGLAIVGLAVVLTPATASAQVGGRQTQQFTLGTRAIPNLRKPSGQLDTLNDLFAALRACWVPPPLVHARQGMEMTIVFSFNRDGALIGPPRVTYATPGVSPETRDVYREAMTRSLQNCTPFPFTSGLGGAVAGRPMSVRIIDDRDDSVAKPRV